MVGTRLQIVSAFVLFSVLVAPFAWKLAQVRRVDLPFERVDRLAAFQSRLLTWQRSNVEIWYREDEQLGLDAPVRRRIIDQAPSLAFQFRSLTNQQRHRVDESFSNSKDLQALDDTLLYVLEAKQDPTRMHQFTFFLLCDPSHQDQSLTKEDKWIVMGKHRHAWTFACSFEDAKTTKLLPAFVRLLNSHVFPSTATLAPFSQPSLQARSALNYRLSFSLLKESPETHWHWHFPTIATRFLLPFLDKISSLASFTIEHQVLQYAKIAKKVNSEGNNHFVKASDLQQFFSVNDVLDTSVLNDREQVLRFKAALPDVEHSPLSIESESSTSPRATSFEIPSLGGVCILDTGRLLTSKQAAQDEMQRMMSVFVSQLRDLLGFPSFALRAQQETGLHFLPAVASGVCEWEMDVQLRHRVDELFKWTIGSLGSIEKLVREMPQMAVLERVEYRITNAVDLLEQVQDQVLQSNSTDWRLLVTHLRKACHQADMAYYDPTMIRQLYFPQEHMLGVYAPLLAPLFLPFFMGLMRELKRFRQKRLQHTAKDKAKHE